MAGFRIHRVRVTNSLMNAVCVACARVLNAARVPTAVRILRRAVSCGLLMFVIPAYPAFSQSPATGPFMQRDQFPVRMLFLGLRPETGDLLPRRSIQWAVQFDYANTYASTLPVGDTLIADDYYRAAPPDEYRLFVDTESLRLSVDLDWRIASRLQFGMTLPFLKHGGGFLDGVVEGFHGAFNLSNGGREWAPRNDYGVFVVRDRRFWIRSVESAGFRPGDLVVRMKTPLNRGGGRVVMAIAGALKLPTGSLETLTGSGGWDFQAAFFATWRPDRPKRDMIFHANLAHSRLGRPTHGEGFPLRSITTLVLAFEYRTTGRLAALLQTQVNIGPFPSSRLGPLNRTAIEATAGARYALSESLSLDAGLTENLSQYQNTPDVGMHVGIVWRTP
ncbi:MAG: DUF3187 family protein [Gemmatimonadota bacterium]|nr:DUF3187 family protein [Gemmatimonadota bacterium]